MAPVAFVVGVCFSGESRSNIVHYRTHDGAIIYNCSFSTIIPH